MGAFDHLIPTTRLGGAFDHLIPDEGSEDQVSRAATRKPEPLRQISEAPIDPDQSMSAFGMADIPTRTPVDIASEAGDKSMLDHVRDTTAAVGKIVPEAVKGVAQFGNWVTQDTVDLGVIKGTEKAQEWLDEVIASPQFNVQQKQFAKLMADDQYNAADMAAFLLDNPALIVDKGITTIGSMFAPMAAAGKFGAIAKAASLAKGASAMDASVAAGNAATKASIITSALQNGADTYDELKDRSGWERNAGGAVSFAASLLVGKITEGGAEAEVAKRLLGDLKAAKPGVWGAVTSFLKSAGKEGTQELGEELGNVGGEMTGGHDAPSAQGLGKRLALAGGLGAIMGGAGHMVPARSGPQNPEPTPAANPEPTAGPDASGQWPTAPSLPGDPVAQGTPLLPNNGAIQQGPAPEATGPSPEAVEADQNAASVYAARDAEARRQEALAAAQTPLLTYNGAINVAPEAAPPTEVATRTPAEITAARVEAARAREEARLAKVAPHRMEIDPANPSESIKAIAAAPLPEIAPALSTPAGLNPEAHANAAGDLAAVLATIQQRQRDVKVVPPGERAAIHSEIADLTAEAGAMKSRYADQFGETAAQHMHTAAARTAQTVQIAPRKPAPVQESKESTERELSAKVNELPGTPTRGEVQRQERTLTPPTTTSVSESTAEGKPRIVPVAAHERNGVPVVAHERVIGEHEDGDFARFWKRKMGVDITGYSAEQIATLKKNVAKVYPGGLAEAMADDKPVSYEQKKALEDIEGTFKREPEAPAIESKPDFREFIEKRKAEIAERENSVKEAFDTHEIAVGEKDGRRIALTKGVGDEGKYRVTSFDKDGEPTGHRVYNDLKEASREFAGHQMVKAGQGAKAVTADDVAYFFDENGKLVKPKRPLIEYGALIAATKRGKTHTADNAAAGAAARVLTAKMPSELPSVLEGNPRPLTERERMVIAAALRDELADGMPESAFAGLGSFHAYKPADAQESGQHFILPNGETTIGFNEDLLANALDGHAPSLAALKNYLDHEMGHEIDSAQAVSDDYASTVSPLFKITRAASGRVAQGIIMKEVLAVHATTRNYRLAQFLSYPMGFWTYSPKQIGVANETLAQKVLQVEVMAQLQTLWHNNRELLRTELPHSYALMKELYGELGQIKAGPGADRRVAQAVHRTLRTGRGGTANDGSDAGPNARRQAAPRFGERSAQSELDLAAAAESIERQLQGLKARTAPRLSTKGHDNEISTRNPTGVKATEDPVASHLAVGVDSARRDLEAFAQNVKLLAGFGDQRTVAGESIDQKFERVVEHLKSNLLWLYKQVPADIRERSQKWYDGANAIAKDQADKYGKSIRASSGVLASLSPQKDWFMNVSLGRRVIDTMENHKNTPWSPRMTETAARIFGKPQYAGLMSEIKGKKLSELTELDQKAAWVRTYDEAHNARSYYVIHPEGTNGDWARNKDGSQSKVAWGSLNEIGKAVSVWEDSSVANISKMLGDQHKVRSFYNNIVNPNSSRPHTTIDTHAVAAAHLLPLAGASPEVVANFGGIGTKNSVIHGNQGTYGLYHEAYRRAAAEVGIQPRQMQSITWEAVRGLFPAAEKNAMLEPARAIWKEYANGKQTAVQARKAISRLAGGITNPDWVSDTGRDGATGRTGDTGELFGNDLPGRDSFGVDSGGRAEPSAGTATLADFKAGNVAELLSKQGWAVITGENPNNKPASAAANKKSNAALEADLKELGVDYQPVLGSYGGPQEHSFVVTGISPEDAARLRDKYQQDSFLASTGFQHADGTVTPALSIEEKPGAEDFYTQMPDGTRWAANMDWDNRSLVNTPNPIKLKGAKGVAPKSVAEMHAQRNANIAENAEKIAAMDEDTRDNTELGDFPGGPDAYNLYEAGKLMPKPSDKLKRVTERNSFSLSQDYDAIANVDGKLYGVSKDEDPDADENIDEENAPFIYTYAPLAAPNGASVTTDTNNAADLIAAIREGSTKLTGAKARAVPPAPPVPPGTNPNATAGNPATWSAPVDSKLDTFIHTMQDKHVDTKRIVSSIVQTIGQIADKVDVYLQEELFHGRTAKQTSDFLDRELHPLIQEMADKKVAMADFETFLHNRHAEERNIQIAKVNPKYPDGGSGIDTADARAYLAGLSPDQRMIYDALAAKVDAILKKTQQIKVAGRLESQATIDAWNNAYSNYVPLHREDMDQSGPGTGMGYSVRGGQKRATGSDKAVENILGNIALDRERTITRAEKNRISNALVALAAANPNKDFWEVDRPPTITYIAQNGLAVTTVDPTFKQHDNVVVARMLDANGNIVERAVIFQKHNDRAARMAASLKSVDAEQLHGAVKFAAGLTRYFAAINTQYNPIFGVVNLTRDVGTGMFNLSTTALKGQQLKVLARTIPALVGIMRDLRAHRRGQPRPSGWATTFEQFQDVGGQTGYRDLFMTGEDRANAIKKELERAQGGGFSALPQTFRWLGGLIADYNTAMENAVRVSTYKAGIEKGLSPERAASISKNLTVNFNRKGAKTLNAGALYAFFNASVQGNARMIETLKGPKGAQIILGATTFGVLQAMALAAAGFDDDEPPEFVKERNIIIPIGGKKYVTIPMPQGLNLLPSIGRVGAEYVLSGFRKPGERVRNLASQALDSFNPMGGGNSWSQMLTPTILDPIVALGQNEDWTGKPIAREDLNPLAPTPGPLRAKEGASPFSKVVSEGINKATLGTDYTPGAWSPTPDQIDYLIGQFTGGVGREISKTASTVSAVNTGEALPAHKIPGVGRFYGDAEDVTGQSSKFYENLKDLNQHEAEIKGRKANGGEWQDYLAEHPEASLVERANAVEREVSKLRRDKRKALADGADRQDIKDFEERINDKMRTFNELVKDAR